MKTTEAATRFASLAGVPCAGSNMSCIIGDFQYFVSFEKNSFCVATSLINTSSDLDLPYDMDMYDIMSGLKILSIEKLPYSDPALTIVIRSALYRVYFPDDVTKQHLLEQMNGLMSQESILRERRGKTYDMKPLIESWECGLDEDNEVYLDVQMAARDSAMGRPDELADELGYDPFAVNIVRKKYILEEMPAK